MWLVFILDDDDLCQKLEVDLYKMGIDLLDFFRGKISLRRLIAFATNLPNDSLVKTEMAFREQGELVLWDEKAYMLADIIDELRSINYYTQANLQIKMKDPEKPPIPRPAIRPKAKDAEEELPAPQEFASAQEINAFINAFSPNAPIL